MSTPEIIFAALASCAPIISVVIAILALRRNNNNDTKSESKEMGKLEEKVDTANKGIERIEQRLDKRDERDDKITERVTALETKVDAHISDKNAHNYSSASSRKKQ